MTQIFLFEHYVIVNNNTWSLINNYRLTEYDKRKQLTELKRKAINTTARKRRIY